MIRALLVLLSVAVVPLRALPKSIEAFVKNSVFYSPEAGSYIETDILITGNSIGYVRKDNGKFFGAIETTLLFRQGSVIANYDKYTLHSVEIDDTLSVLMSLIDKKRFALPAGAYTMEATFKDLNSPEEPYTYTEPLIIDYDENKVALSDIMLVDAYRKTEEESIYDRNGYHLSPYVINFYPDNINKLIFYAELYNSNQLNDQCLAMISIRRFKLNSVAGNLHSYQKIPPQQVNVLFSEFDITNLMTGNYNLVIEIRNKANELLAIKQHFFQRYKKLEPASEDDLSGVFIENTFVEHLSPQALAYHLSSALPVANVSEAKRIRELIKKNDRMEMARYLLYFWMTRNSADPRSEWERHRMEVKKVNDSYSTTLEYGFETDRGRVYLQYGPPTEIIQSPREPGALPYEIWQYNLFRTGQTNVKFVFYNRDLVSNNYILLHSTANGEIRNDQWESVIHEPFTGGENPIDQGYRSPRDNYGSRMNFYNDW